jgi:hypothetical protein
MAREEPKMSPALQKLMSMSEADIREEWRRVQREKRERGEPYFYTVTDPKTGKTLYSLDEEPAR